MLLKERGEYKTLSLVERAIADSHELVRRNKAFCMAMLRASKHPDPEWRIRISIGVSEKPCTQQPRFVDMPRDIPIRSPSAWIAELAGDL